MDITTIEEMRSERALRHLASSSLDCNGSSGRWRRQAIHERSDWILFLGDWCSLWSISRGVDGIAHLFQLRLAQATKSALFLPSLSSLQHAAGHATSFCTQFNRAETQHCIMGSSGWLGPVTYPPSLAVLGSSIKSLSQSAKQETTIEL